MVYIYILIIVFLFFLILQEAINQLKTINETKKSARDDSDEERDLKLEIQKKDEMVAAMDKIQVSSYFSNSNNNSKFTNNGNGMKKVSSGGNIQLVQPDSDSDLTLTDSSDDDDVVRNVKFNIQSEQSENEYTDKPIDRVDRYNEIPCESNSHQGNNNNQVLPSSPSKMTRKVAPKAGKFSTANDTLSMLKALSQQASYLTSNGSQSSKNLEQNSAQHSIEPSSGAFLFSAPNGANLVPVTSFPQLNEQQSVINNTSSRISFSTVPNFTSAPGHIAQPELNPQKSFGKPYSSNNYNKQETDENVNMNDNDESSGSETECESDEEIQDQKKNVKFSEQSNQRDSPRTSGGLTLEENTEKSSKEAIPTFDDDVEWTDEEAEDEAKTCLKCE